MISNSMVKVTFMIALLMMFCQNNVQAENIDPDNDGSQYAYGENVGWLNFEPNLADPDVGASVSQTEVSGYIWAENIGWINLYPATYGGVNNDGAGNLSGYAWGENVGWINFDPTYGGVTIDSDGDFDGWAWGENIGWIHFQSASPVAYKVKVCVVDLERLAAFLTQWTDSGVGLTADLYEDGEVDIHDYTVFASYWLDYCPDEWEL